MASRISRVLIFALLTICALAQTPPGSSSPQPETDPLKRPVDKKTSKRQAQQLKKESPYLEWPEGDAAKWIITDEEREAFRKLTNDEERDNFIEAFWARRDPTPDTLENEYKEEHYRRVAYANEHFASGKPGWLTDRGHIYIAWGPPDQIESHPTGGSYIGDGTQREGIAFPFELWRYRYLEGRDLGQEVDIEFVDTCQCGDYHIALDPTEKNALKSVPGHTEDFTSRLGEDPSKQFQRLAQYAAVTRAPEVKFKDLLPHVGTTVRYNILPFNVRVDFARLTPDTALVPITVQLKNKDVTWTGKDGVQRMVVHILGRVTGFSGKTVQTFEDTVTDMIADDLLAKTVDNSHVYWKALPLRPGRYRLDLVLKDVNSDQVGTWSKAIDVPQYEQDKLATSTLILADIMEKVATKSVNTGNFVIGETKVRPRVDNADGRPALFRRTQPLNA